MLKEPLVIHLVKTDFGHASNRQLVAAAIDQKIAFRYYFEGTVIDHSILCCYPGGERAPAYFPTIDFRRAGFIRAIEDYVIESSRAIVVQAARGDAMTAISQIFGQSAMALIEMGRLPMRGDFVPGNRNRKPYDPARAISATPGVMMGPGRGVFPPLRLVKD